MIGNISGMCSDVNNLVGIGSCIFQFGFLNNPYLFIVAIMIGVAFLLYALRLPLAFLLPLGLGVVYMMLTLYPNEPILETLFILGLVALAVITVLMVIKYAKK